MGTCQSMFLKDVMLFHDRILENDLVFNSGRLKEALKCVKGKYAGIRAVQKLSSEKFFKLQSGEWWKYLF